MSLEEKEEERWGHTQERGERGGGGRCIKSRRKGCRNEHTTKRREGSWEKMSKERRKSVGAESKRSREHTQEQERRESTQTLMAEVTTVVAARFIPC